MLPTAIAPNVAAQQAGIPPLIDVFNLAKYPLDPVIAAVFGLTPDLLISRLGDQAAKLKTNISSTDPTNQA
jgi:hypothetical protein